MTLITVLCVNHINNLVTVTLTFDERRTMAERLFKPLSNGRYVKVSEWQKEPRVDLRQHEVCNDKEIPTKKGISLKLVQFKTLLAAMDSVQDVIRQNKEQSCHLGYNVYIHVKENNPCVDIRQYWKPDKESDIVPTRKGLCLRPFEFSAFEALLVDENCIPELKDVQCCSERDDHQNQMGILQCNICNPNESNNW